RTCSGTSLRKGGRKLKISQHTQYTCSFCGKTQMKKWATWQQRSQGKMVAGGAWSYSTPSGATVKLAIRCLKELR
ncbi:hypothetical protein PANDA_012195, partial [Ailuropoda melanoleuca]